MVFVNFIYDMVVDTEFHKFYDRPFARVLYSIFDVFVNYIYDMVVDTQFHKFYDRPFARVLYLFLIKDIDR